MEQTLAQEWRRRMAARSTIGALLLALGVFATATIGFGGGLGALPFSVSSLTVGPDGGPGRTSGQALQGRAVAQLAGGPVVPATATTQAPSASSPSAAPGAGGSPAPSGSVTPPSTPPQFQGGGPTPGGGGSNGTSTSGGSGSPGGAATTAPPPAAGPVAPPGGPPIVNQIGTGVQQTLGTLLGTGQTP